MPEKVDTKPPPAPSLRLLGPLLRSHIFSKRAESRLANALLHVLRPKNQLQEFIVAPGQGEATDVNE